MVDSAAMKIFHQLTRVDRKLVHGSDEPLTRRLALELLDPSRKVCTWIGGVWLMYDKVHTVPLVRSDIVTKLTRSFFRLITKFDAPENYSDTV